MIDIEKNNNYRFFLWHAFWLALAKAFADTNTVMPSLILTSGGTQLHVGILTSIMVGVPLISQILFAGYVSSKPKKKKFLLLGIYLRVAALAGVGVTLFIHESISAELIIILVFLWMFAFSISGALAGVPYTDILGKTIKGELRKKFFVRRQLVSSIGLFLSALIVRQLLRQFEYPKNYELMFTFAPLFLFIAAIGFLFLKETESLTPQKKVSVWSQLKKVPFVLKTDSNMKNLLFTINLYGLGFTSIPFITASIKSGFDVPLYWIGNFLTAQIFGMIISNFLWSKVVKQYKFKGVMKAVVVIQSSIPLLAILFFGLLDFRFFTILFFVNGISFSGYRIASSGVFIEITNDANRALYTGIYGSFNLAVAIIPLVLGSVILFTGYTAVFIVVSFLTLLSYRFVSKLNCG